MFEIRDHPQLAVMKERLFDGKDKQQEADVIQFVLSKKHLTALRSFCWIQDILALIAKEKKEARLKLVQAERKAQEAQEAEQAAEVARQAEELEQKRKELEDMQQAARIAKLDRDAQEARVKLKLIKAENIEKRRRNLERTKQYGEAVHVRHIDISFDLN